MDPERWRQIDRLLSEVLKREPGERKNFLQQACTGDDELLKEVSLLLKAHDRAGSFMEEPALDQAVRLPPPSLIGRNVGPYEILSLLGRGGMGEVYKVRDARLDRINALEILPAEVASVPDRLRRFIREAKAASALNHPNIATIYEIGHFDSCPTLARTANREGNPGRLIQATIPLRSAWLGHPTDKRSCSLREMDQSRVFGGWMSQRRENRSASGSHPIAPLNRRFRHQGTAWLTQCRGLTLTSGAST